MNEITVAIVSYNAMKFLPYSMERLQMQKIPNLPVMLIDQGSSDGTQGWASEVMGRNYYLKKSQEKNSLNFSFFQRTQDSKNHPYVNAMAARKFAAKACKTPYIFHLDADTLIHALTLPRALDILQERDLTYLGIKYEPDAADSNHDFAHKHIMLGATLWKTNAFLELPEFKNEDLKNGCDCNFCYREVKKLGGKADHVSMGAYHLKGVLV